jgi:ribosomal protein S18 acetylase RimI-like enzyme
MEHARAADVDDIGEIALLAHLMLDELEPTRGGAVWARRERRDGPYETAYGTLLERDDTFVVVGTVHDVVVGFGVVMLESLRDGGVLGVITDLFVHPDARSIGVGEAMVGQLVAFCSEHHCIGIDALVLPGHRAAKNFFEESGFTARALVMHHLPTSDGEAPAG